VTLARRLLMMGPSFAPLPPPVTLTSAPDGGWTQIQDARALAYNGYLYFGYVDGTSGDAEVRYATDTGASVGGPFAMHGSAISTPPDTHDAPGMLVMDNGKLIVAYCEHNGTTLWGRISVNSLDTDPTLSGGFGTEFTIKGSSDFTYPFVMQRLAETNTPIYVWYRIQSGGTNILRYSKSIDHGANWTHSGNVWADGAGYWKIATDGQWRIDFFCTEGNPSEATSRIFHFYADDVSYHASDGTVIGDVHDSGSGCTLVYDSADGPGWPTDAWSDGANPVMVYSVDNGSATDSDFRYARWDGSAWDKSEVIASVGAGIVDPAPVAAIDSARPTERVHLVRLISGQWELWRYTSTDTGATWTGAAVTSGSVVDNLYPVNVSGHTVGKVAVLWLYGDYTGAETDFDLGIKGAS
jgi:hypothetical protein